VPASSRIILRLSLRIPTRPSNLTLHHYRLSPPRPLASSSALGVGVGLVVSDQVWIGFDPGSDLRECCNAYFFSPKQGISFSSLLISVLLVDNSFIYIISFNNSSNSLKLSCMYVTRSLKDQQNFEEKA